MDTAHGGHKESDTTATFTFTSDPVVNTLPSNVGGNG